MRIDDVDVLVEGAGREAIVLIHGWPDTHRLWDPQVAALGSKYRCVRFTLPGFDLSRQTGPYSMDEVLDTIARIVEQTCPGERVTLLLHDWGCFFGYQFAIRYPQLVKRVIGVDVGDAGSRRNIAAMSVKQKAFILGYQTWLATSWKVGGALGDRMARWMAGAAQAPAPAPDIGAQMGYPYAVQWFKVKGGFGSLRAFHPQVPMLFIYGRRKPAMFHSQAWLDALAEGPHNLVIGLPTGHWVMVEQPEAFNEAVLAWLKETDGYVDGLSGQG